MLDDLTNSMLARDEVPFGAESAGACLGLIKLRFWSRVVRVS